MKSIKFSIKLFQTAKGITFPSASVKGKYLPFATADEDTYYRIKFVGDVKMPEKEGFFEVSYKDKECWIDKRPEYVDKHIVRIKAVRVVSLD